MTTDYQKIKNNVSKQTKKTNEKCYAHRYRDRGERAKKFKEIKKKEGKEESQIPKP